MTMVPVTMNRWQLLLPEHRVKQWEHPWEAARLESMHANLKPGDLIVDAGAEEGDLPCLWASWGCDVVLAEPSPAVWANMRAIFEANELTDRVKACWVGFLGDETRSMTRGWARQIVGSPPPSPWPKCADGPVTDAHAFSVLVERPDIPVTTIDLLAETAGAPQAITVDTEGSELRVLRGAEHTLRHRRPLVWVSVHLDHAWVALKFPGEDGYAVDEFMTSVGYEGHVLAEDHERHVFYVPGERVDSVVLP